MERVYWAERAGRRYLVVDYTGADAEQMLVIAEASVRVIGAEPERFPLLVDVTDASMSSAWLAVVKRSSKDVVGPKVTRCAVLGVTGIKATVLRGVNTVGGGLRALPFRDEEQALAYLLKD